ncbi:hypothetical protein ACRXTK_001293 [Escherichia coli]
MSGISTCIDSTGECKNLRRAASFIRAGIARQMMIAQLCMREAQRLEQMETNGD